MKVTAFSRIIGTGLLTLLFVVGCTKNPIFYSQSNPIRTDGWENTGSVNASFVTSERSLSSSISTGTPTFNVTYIATASNVDSLSWQFPGGTPASSTLVQQIVQYNGYGTFDVGLKAYNTEDRDIRYYNDYIRSFYKDDWSFSSDSWTITGTTELTDFEPYFNSNGDQVPSWIFVSHTVENVAECTKVFSGFPTNRLALEFEYRLRKKEKLYVATTYTESSTTATNALGVSETNTFTLTSFGNIVTYVAADATPKPTLFTSPTEYPGIRRLVLKYNGIVLWAVSNMTDGRFIRVKLSLPSLSNFNLNFIKGQCTLNDSGVIEYPFETEIRNLSLKLEEDK
tara:strand:- start:12 stop:1031 length:1020 start_codon:yes stop_codon:yes gene_type:complete